MILRIAPRVISLLKFYGWFAAAYGTCWLTTMLLAVFTQSRIDTGEFGLIGLAKGNYAMDAKVFICPGDFEIIRKSSDDFGYGPNWEEQNASPDLRVTSYAYWYVPPSGDFYKFWSVIAGQDEWFPSMFKHLERHDIRQAKAATLAILVECPALGRWVGDSFHPGDGGNVLYLDGHVTWVNRMPKEMLPPPVTTGLFAPYDDGTKGVNYIDHGGSF